MFSIVLTRQSRTIIQEHLTINGGVARLQKPNASLAIFCVKGPACRGARHSFISYRSHVLVATSQQALSKPT